MIFLPVVLVLIAGLTFASRPTGKEKMKAEGVGIGGGRLTESELADRSLLIGMANLLEVSESGSTSEEEDRIKGGNEEEEYSDGRFDDAVDDLNDDFVLMDDEKPSRKTVTSPRQPQVTLVSLGRRNKSPRHYANGSLSQSSLSTSSHSLNHSVRSSGRMDGSTTSSGTALKTILGGSLLIEDYRSDSSISAGRGLGFLGSGPSSRSGSEIWSGSRSRINESPHSLSSSAISIKRHFWPGRTEIIDLLSTWGLYIDKSGWIHKLLSSAPRFSVILRPSQFGKTMAINSGRLYLDHTMATIRNCELGMHRTGRYGQEHAFKYCTVMVGWKEAGIMEASGEGEFKMSVIRYIGGLIREMMKRYGKTADDIPLDLYNRWDELAGDFPSADISIWADSLALLLELGHSFSGRPVVLFIDDYDSILFKAYALGCFDSVSSFFSQLYLRVSGLEDRILFKAAIFGVHRLHDFYPFKQVQRLRYFGLGDQVFTTHDSGFNVPSDLLHIQNNYVQVTNISSKDCTEMFGGYPSGSTGSNLMAPAGVIKSFMSGNIKASHGYDHLYLDLDALPFRHLQGFGVGDMYKTLLNNEPFKDINAIHIDLHRHAHPPTSHVFLTFLRHEGLLTFREKDLVVPNKSSSEFLNHLVFTWFERRYSIVGAWWALANFDMKYFRERMTKAWNLKNFLQGLSPCFAFDTTPFIGLIMESVNRMGNHIPHFHDHVQSIRNDEDGFDRLNDIRLVRFASTPTEEDQLGSQVLLSFAWTESPDITDIHGGKLLKESQRFYYDLMDRQNHGKAGHSHHQPYPPYRLCVSVIFCKQKTDPIIVFV